MRQNRKTATRGGVCCLFVELYFWLGLRIRIRYRAGLGRFGMNIIYTLSGRYVALEAITCN